jgi:hydroxypyruvate isomerase
LELDGTIDFRQIAGDSRSPRRDNLGAKLADLHRTAGDGDAMSGNASPVAFWDLQLYPERGLKRMLKIAANISRLFRELPVLERFQAARVAGFDGIEMQFPYAESPQDLARAAEAADSPVLLINGPILAGTHPFGIAGRPEMRESFRAQVPQIREYAEELKVHFVHILAGTTNGPDERAQCWDSHVDNLLFAADALRDCHVQVLIEPLNSHDIPG